MAKNTERPIGGSVAERIAIKRASSPEYRRQSDRIAPLEAIARVVIMRRAELGLTQGELAMRMGTTSSVISRIESGTHQSSVATWKRLAEALDGRAVFGFQFEEMNPEIQKLVIL